MKILGDNDISLTLIKDLENQNRIKHINVIYHYIQELIENRDLRIK